MTYDYVFAGMGLSGFLLLHEMAKHNEFHAKKILIIEPDAKQLNDRTWCFWEKGVGEWDFLLFKKWDKAFFKNDSFEVDCLNGELFYKMIAASDFYNYVKNELTVFTNLEWRQELVVSYEQKDSKVRVITENNSYSGGYLFSAISVHTKNENPSYPLLKQHFLGWVVQVDVPFFNENDCFFMDFSVAQNDNTRFMYVLPLGPDKALVEYTLFSPEILPTNEYEFAIKDYLQKKGVGAYTIEHIEQGVIPMTACPFWKHNTSRILHIGTAGGWTKASTGFTFQNTVKKVKELVLFIKQDNFSFESFHKTNRFAFYDALLVAVLYQNNALGYRLFSNLFKKVNPVTVLRFLDEETTIAEDLRVISACPKVPFLKALWGYLVQQR